MLNLQPFFDFHRRQTRSLSAGYRRYLFDSIELDQRAILLYGFRGVGKTTLLQQLAQSRFRDIEQWLYLTADFYLLADRPVYELVDAYLKQQPGKLIVVDEVQKLPDWRRMVKNLIDGFPDVKFWFSGSSSIQLSENLTGSDTAEAAAHSFDADLNRRWSRYELRPMSFREYLNFRHKLDLPAYALSKLLADHTQIADHLVTAIKPLNTTVLKEFSDYLQHGCYPFYFEARNEDVYLSRLQALVEDVIEQDIGQLLGLKMPELQSVKKLYSTIASSPPFEPNIAKLAEACQVHREKIYQYLHYLELAGLTRNIYRDISKAMHITSKADKICLANTNLQVAHADSRVVSDRQIGSTREVFFVANFSPRAIVCHPRRADFMVGDLSFEIGGAAKSRQQVWNESHPYLVVDDTEVSYETGKLPLYLFGFLY